jgi:hypothetical protein
MRFALSAALVAIVVLLVGVAFVGGSGRWGVVAGVAMAFVFQVGAFWLLAGVFFRDRPAIVYGLGMVGRFGLVAVVALVVAPALGMPAAPTLFSLLATLFLTTLLEPVFFQSALSHGR